MNETPRSILDAERQLSPEKANNWLFDVSRQIYKERPRQDRCFKSLATISDPVEAAWKLFYTLRAVGEMRELRDWREPLVKHLEENQLWLPGVTIDCYLEGVSYHTKYIDLRRGTDWIEVAKTRFSLAQIKSDIQYPKIPIAPLDCHKGAAPKPTVVKPKKRTHVETLLKETIDFSHLEYAILPPLQSPSKRLCIDLEEYDDKGYPLHPNRADQPPVSPTSSAPHVPSPHVPLTQWPFVDPETYPSLISNAETGIKLPPLHRDEFSVEPGPHDWREGDIQHWFDALQSACDRIKVITLPLTYAELKTQAEEGRKGKRKAQYKYTPEEEVQWEKTVVDWDDAAAGLPVIEGDAILKTTDGEVVLYKLDTALVDGWEDAELGAKFVAHLTENLETLRKAWAGFLPTPGQSDNRHHAFEQMRERYGKENVGVWHFAFWLVTGQPHRGPVVSAESLGGPNVYRYEPVQRFLQSIVPLQQAAAIIFQLLEPEACKRYKRNFEALAAKYTTMRSTFRTTPRATFLGLAIPFQVRVLPHKDNADDPEGYVGMTNLGTYTGGDLIVGSDGTMLRFAYQPGQFVVFKSALLRHGVMPFEGTRRALVLFSHEAVWKFAK